MAGWAKIHRSIQSHWIWENEKYLKWWLDLILMANHQENTILINGDLKKIDIGARHTSELKLSKRWNADRKAVRKFLSLLEKDGMISIEKSKQNGTTYKVTNYGVYQGNSEETEQPKGQRNEQREGQQKDNAKDIECPINKNVKNEKNEKNDKEIKDSPPKPPKRIYEDDSIYLKLAQQLFDNILANNPEAKKPNLQIWADDFRKLIELDKRSEEQAINMIAWSQSNSFWQGVILSAKKLRDKYDQMKVQATRDYKSQKGGYNQQSNRKETLPDWAKEEQHQVEEKPMSEEEQAAFKERIKRIQESGSTD
ncbi:MAG: hypothetical protein RR936_12845 [Carnobacterium sp.]|uniref:hypothetical protein n=1 Tax=Carnobacterium sp. TaxID=48221 RepID=UPI002FC73C23